MTLKQKVRLFVKIQAATFAIGLAFIIRENSEHGFTLQMTYDHVRLALFGDAHFSSSRWGWNSSRHLELPLVVVRSAQ